MKTFKPRKKALIVIATLRAAFLNSDKLYSLFYSKQSFNSLSEPQAVHNHFLRAEIDIADFLSGCKN